MPSPRKSTENGWNLAWVPALILKILTLTIFRQIEYDTYVSDASRQRIAINLVFTNKLPDGTLKNIAFEVVDSVGLAVDVTSGGVTEMPVVFAQMPPKSNWNMTLELVLRATAASPQTVRGTVTYMKVDAAGSGQEMRDFRLRLGCSAFLLPVQVSVDEFGLVLESGQLAASAEAHVEVGSRKFADLLTRICFQGRFFLVEQIATSATLHAMSILQQRVAVMIKLLPGGGGGGEVAPNNRLALTAKSADPALTGPLLEEIVAALRTNWTLSGKKKTFHRKKIPAHFFFPAEFSPAFLSVIDVRVLHRRSAGSFLSCQCIFLFTYCTVATTRDD